MNESAPQNRSPAAVSPHLYTLLQLTQLIWDPHSHSPPRTIPGPSDLLPRIPEQLPILSKLLQDTHSHPLPSSGSLPQYLRPSPPVALGSSEQLLIPSQPLRDSLSHSESPQAIPYPQSCSGTLTAALPQPGPSPSVPLPLWTLTPTPRPLTAAPHPLTPTPRTLTPVPCPLTAAPRPLTAALPAAAQSRDPSLYSHFQSPEAAAGPSDLLLAPSQTLQTPTASPSSP